jgi:hypothetical protein
MVQDTLDGMILSKTGSHKNSTNGWSAHLGSTLFVQSDDKWSAFHRAMRPLWGGMEVQACRTQEPVCFACYARFLATGGRRGREIPMCKVK